MTDDQLAELQLDYVYLCDIEQKAHDDRVEARIKLLTESLRRAFVNSPSLTELQYDIDQGLYEMGLLFTSPVGPVQVSVYPDCQYECNFYAVFVDENDRGDKAELKSRFDAVDSAGDIQAAIDALNVGSWMEINEDDIMEVFGYDGYYRDEQLEVAFEIERESFLKGEVDFSTLT